MNFILYALILLLIIRLEKLVRVQRKMLRILNEIRHSISAPERIAIYFNGELTEIYFMKDNQQVVATITAIDSKGNAAGSFDSAPVWTVADQSVVSMEVAADGLSATFKALGKLGATDVQVSASASGKALVGSGTVTVVAGDAVSIALQFAAPTDVVDAAPAQQ